MGNDNRVNSYGIWAGNPKNSLFAEYAKKKKTRAITLCIVTKRISTLFSHVFPCGSKKTIKTTRTHGPFYNDKPIEFEFWARRKKNMYRFYDYVWFFRCFWTTFLSDILLRSSTSRMIFFFYFCSSCSFLLLMTDTREYSRNKAFVLFWILFFSFFSL